MEKIENLLKGLNNIKKDFLEVEKLEENNLIKGQELLRRVIDNLLPIIRFIDEKIIISYKKYNYKGRDIYQFFDESGIILFNSFETENTGDYPHENNYWDYFGYQIVLKP